MTGSLRVGSLVLYNGRPARILVIGGKIEIETEAGRTVRVRPKDISLLHPGPVELADLLALYAQTPPQGEVETAWELLVGGSTTLAELAELAYGEYTPLTAWAIWEVVADGLYFRGRPEEVVARSPEEVAATRAARAARAEAEKEWAAFLQRVRAGQVLPEDERYLREVEALALGRQEGSRLLQALGQAERPENAHALLLRLGYWDATFDPYPLRLGLPTDPPQVEVPDLPPEERVDLSDLPAFAIDDADCRDPDDALSWDGESLWVHVADVAALIPPDSPADLEARARGSTLYLPEGAVPMLPRPALEQLGLGLQEVSPACSFRLQLAADGTAAAVEVVPSWVRVTRVPYEEAEERLEEEPFRTLNQLAERFLAYRRTQGAVEIELPEVKVVVEDGQVILRPLPPLRSRDLVREAMLMAGHAVARYALERGIPFPFSLQDPSDPPADLPEGLAGMVALRQNMLPARQSSIPGRHAGLGLGPYAQVTSPLRRYLDLVAHQQLRAFLQGREPLGSTALLERVGAAAAVGGSVRQAERLAERHWTLVYLMQHPDWRGEGVLVEVRPRRRGTVLIPDLGVTASLHLPRPMPLNSTLALVLKGLNLAELDLHLVVEA